MPERGIERGIERAIDRRPAWDGYDAYLFDIDGTLLHCTDAVHYFAFLDALKTLSGGEALNLDRVVVHGNTDVGILRDALRAAGVAEAAWRPKLADACAGMCRWVGARQDELTVNVLPGVERMLAHLQAKGAVLGVATGNLEGIGRAKLARAGLLQMFSFAGYSDDYEYRRDVFAAALGKAESLAGTGARVCVVGDTPEDVRAARANGLDVIATATGIFPFEELLAESPTLCVHSLEDLFP